MIDATGKYVFPGFIDPHVHIYLPFMGTVAKDTHETASQRGAGRRDDDVHRDDLSGARMRSRWKAFELWLGKARGKSARATSRSTWA